MLSATVATSSSWAAAGRTWQSSYAVIAIRTQYDSQHVTSVLHTRTSAMTASKHVRENRAEASEAHGRQADPRSEESPAL